jgi:preprotein translocase subunit SecD
MQGCAESSVSIRYELDRAALGATSPPRLKDEVILKRLVASINHRLDNAGEATLLDDGSIQIDLDGDLDEAEVASLKLQASTMGHLEFRIMASRVHSEDELVIKAAESLGQEKKEVVMHRDVVAKWVRYSNSEADPFDNDDDRSIVRQAEFNPEVLVLIDSLHITGDYLSSAAKVIGPGKTFGLEFELNRKGALLLRKLTSNNLPGLQTGTQRSMGIIMDDRLFSAPVIQTTISGRVRLSGLPEHEVDALLAIMNEGMLPYPVREISD